MKASSLLGFIVGGFGSWKILSLVVPGLFNILSSPFVLPDLLFGVGLVLLGGPVALASSLCLMFGYRTDETNDILGFLSFTCSISTVLVLFLYYALTTAP